MEIHIKLTFEKDQEWDYDYSILQGIFYSLLKKNNNFHANNYSMFCFSNVFFEKQKIYKSGNVYNIIFRSIESKIINDVLEGLLLKKTFNFGTNNTIHIKKAFVEKVNNIYSGKTFKFETPLVLSLDSELCEKYNITYKLDGKPLYWNKEMGFDVFINQLNRNIYKKYVYLMKNGYLGKLNNYDQELLVKYDNVDEFNLIADKSSFFQGYRFLRGALVNYKGGKIAGSKWSLIVSNNSNLVKILNFVNQIGFGERCSAGFGFVK